MAHLTAMVQPSAMLLLLLLTSAAAVRYRMLEPVSFPRPAVRVVPAVSEIACGIRCMVLKPENCTGFIYEPGDGTCRLFSGDCRGPAVSSSQQVSGRYLARHEATGEVT